MVRESTGYIHTFLQHYAMWTLTITERGGLPRVSDAKTGPAMYEEGNGFSFLFFISFFHLFFPRQVQKKKHGSCLRAVGVVRAWEGFSIFDPFGWGDFFFFFLLQGGGNEKFSRRSEQGKAARHYHHSSFIIRHHHHVVGHTPFYRDGRDMDGNGKQKRMGAVNIGLCKQIGKNN